MDWPEEVVVASITTKTNMGTKAKTKPAKKPVKQPLIDLEKEVAELQILFRFLGEEIIMMRAAGKLAEKEKTYFGDIVTEADLLVEREIVKRLQSRHPDHCVRGEEITGRIMPEVCNYEWIVTPIDGTTNFSKGMRFFSIAVAFLDHGVPTMGAIYFPELSRFIYAIKGKGAFENGKRMERFERPAVNDMLNALVAAATTRKKSGRAEVLGELRIRSMNLINSGAMTYNCLMLAEGKIDAAVHTDAKLFTIAPMIPILEEMGCAISGFEEDYPDLSREGISFIAATNQKLLASIKKNILPVWERAEK
jgi:myo-inositol-1(or 4)-monophosphatase